MINKDRLKRAAQLLVELEDRSAHVTLAPGYGVLDMGLPEEGRAELVERLPLAEINRLYPEIVLLLLVREDSLAGLGAWPLAQKTLGLRPGDLPVGLDENGKLWVLSMEEEDGD